MPEGNYRAFADDVAAVQSDWDSQGAVVEGIFKEFAEMSGLELNIAKTVAKPLWEDSFDDIRQTLYASGSSWGDLCIAKEGTYLGFVVGPGRVGKAWGKPIAKYSKRCREWGGQGLGLYYTGNAYNTFAMSTLLYTAQLVEPSKQELMAEAEGIRRVLPGP